MDLQRASDRGAGPAVVLLPGIVTPAALRFGPLIGELSASCRAFTKELEVYDPDLTPDTYSIDAEVGGLVRAADAAGLERFYLVGYSAGGAVSLAFAGAHPDRVLGLALDEPASDFSDETRAAWDTSLGHLMSLPDPQRLAAFLQAQVAPGVELPPPPPGPSPDWMASRPAGIDAFGTALDAHTLPAPLSGFRGPVYYSFGSLTNPVWRAIRDRLAAVFSDFTAEEYEGLHHLNPAIGAAPARVAGALKRLWRI